MQYDAFYSKIQDLLKDIYTKAGSMRLEQMSGYLREVDARLEENGALISEQTADWTAEDWKNLFYYYIKQGNPEVDRFVGRKLQELCGAEFLRGCIRDHTKLLADDVYTTADKDVLYHSDVLLAAVKLLNRTGEGGADKEVLDAFLACAETNEHILYELAEYLCRNCLNEVTALILEESLEEEKLMILLSMATAVKQRDDELFKAMKQRFKRLPDDREVKSVFAAIFGDYGDPNAILPLRRYMKNLIEIYAQDRDPELFSKIMLASSVVEGLGGSTDDLMP